MQALHSTPVWKVLERLKSENSLNCPTARRHNEESVAEQGGRECPARKEPQPAGLYIALRPAKKNEDTAGRPSRINGLDRVFNGTATKINSFPHDHLNWIFPA